MLGQVLFNSSVGKGGSIDELDDSSGLNSKWM